ncbi:hypothetical protein B0H14DRAFT_107331 [Mycena olivaceomarginata]|nr:hypothetical protein B0H14DRAFT_107331 [Mycena olivaceomarginata]
MRTLRILLRLETRTPTRSRRRRSSPPSARRSRASSSRWHSWLHPTGRTRCTRTSRTRSRRSRRAYGGWSGAWAGCVRGARSSRGRPRPIRARPRVRVAAAARVKARRYSSSLSQNIPTRRRSRSSARGSAAPPAQPALSPHTTYVPPPLSPTNGNGSGTGKRRALDSIPEEEGGDVPLHVLPHPCHTHPAYTHAHADVDVGAGGTLLPLLRAWLAACVALAVYPLYAVLKPVRGVARAVEVGVGRGR